MTDSTPDDERFKQAADDLVHVSDAIQDVDYNALLDEDLQRVLEIHTEIREMLRTYRESRPKRENGVTARDRRDRPLAPPAEFVNSHVYRYHYAPVDEPLERRQRRSE